MQTEYIDWKKKLGEKKTYTNKVLLSTIGSIQCIQSSLYNSSVPLQFSPFLLLSMRDM